MDEIINYRNLSDKEKDKTLSQLIEIGFCPAYGGITSMKREMGKSIEGTLPQYVFVRREGELIGYMFLIAEKEHYSRVFPWWTVDNSDELPLETDIRLLQYGIELCVEANCLKLADRIHSQMKDHKNGIGRRPKHLSR